MKILAVSDEVSESIYSANIRQRFGGVDFVVGCGDLPYYYLEYIVTMLHTPLYYVPGNHDPLYRQNVLSSLAAGCENIDGRIVRYRGLLLAGLGGSIRYKPVGDNQYTQFEMNRRALRLAIRLFWLRLVQRKRPDILVAHSPPFGIHDDADRAHTGFHAFVHLIRVFQPRYFLHGHTLVYKPNVAPPVTRVGETQVINVYPYRVIEIETPLPVVEGNNHER
jgi:Icc-related predicted phosphoesterase